MIRLNKPFLARLIFIKSEPLVVMDGTFRTNMISRPSGQYGLYWI